jgi:5-methylcytosine-specific restriction protein A
VCGFDFAGVYGPRGSNFCEVHHLKPLSDVHSEVETRLQDLAIVCSNCHRMLHREPWQTFPA